MTSTGRRLRAVAGPGPTPFHEDSRPADGPVGVRVEVEVAVVLELLEAACDAGGSIPRALQAVGTAIGGARGDGLTRVAAGLSLGASWDEAWFGCPAALLPSAEALRRSWQDGAPPRGALRTAAEAVRRERHARALEAANRLGVRLVLPLGLCYLPAFVLVGLVPVLVSMAHGLLGA